VLAVCAAGCGCAQILFIDEGSAATDATLLVRPGGVSPPHGHQLTTA